MKSFRSGIIPPASNVPARWFIFHEHRVLVQQADDQLLFPEITTVADLPFRTKSQQFMGLDLEMPCYCAETDSDAILDESWSFVGLRGLLRSLPGPTVMLAGLAFQLVEWNRNHQFCGHCATPTDMGKTERVRTCPKCSLAAYPRVAPAVIVAVSKGEEIFLARAPHFPEGMFSVLAGFVEPGETLEETVHREIFEESGLHVKNVEYFGSQPWPFPHSLMVAFTAEFAGGEIKLDKNELVEADWFRFDELPNIPPRVSIARSLIDDFVSKQHSTTR